METVYIDLVGDKAIIRLEGGKTTDYIKKYIQKQSWLHWERRTNITGRDKLFLIADLSDRTDLNEWKQDRLDRLVYAFQEDGYWLYLKTSDDETPKEYSTFTDDYKEIIREWNTIK